MPQRIFPLKMAVVTFNVAAFLDARLPLGDGDIFEAQLMRLKERALTAKGLVLDYSHCF